MRTLSALTATVALAAGIVGVAPAAAAGHVVLGVGLGNPGIAVVAPPVALVPLPYYYGPAYYGPGYFGAPLFGYRYYARPYLRHAPRGYVHGRGGWYGHR